MPELDVVNDGGHVVVKFKDTQIMDETYARQIGMKLVEIADSSGKRDIVLNFKRVQFMASSMIGQLVLLRNKCKEIGCKLSVCCLSPELSEAICLMNLDKIIDIFECEKTAKAASNEA